MKCPYPDCQHDTEPDSCELVGRTRCDCKQVPPIIPLEAGDVCCCPRCRRLSWTCNQKKCHAQNRLFTRFCRRCGSALYSIQDDSHALGQWRTAAGFSTDWYFRHPTAVSRGRKPSAAMDNTTEVLDLTTLDGFDSAAHVLLEMVFVDGLLALHQGGSTLAVINPFADVGRAESSPVVVWKMAEEEMIKRPVLQESPAATLRPYPPVTSGNRRHLLFSTPYAVLALDLWNLPGWATGRKLTNCRPIFQSAGETGTRLAAAPVPFGGPNDAFGLLLRTTDNRYLWKIVELSPDAATTVRRDQHGVANDEYLNDAIELKLEGGPCQVTRVEDAVIAFSTPRGHWVWTCAAARDGKWQELLQTRQQEGQYDEFCLDRHIEDRARFQYPRQVITLDRDIAGRPQTLTWYYLLREDNSLESYRVNLPDRVVNSPRKSTGYTKAEPLGRRNVDRLPEMLFRSADRCLRLGYGQYELNFIGELHLRTGQVRGFEYSAPLLMTVFLDPQTPRKCEIDLLSVSTLLTAQMAMPKENEAVARSMMAKTSPADESEGNPFSNQARLDPRRMTLEQLDLIAMPLVWSRWLFTLERQDSQGAEGSGISLIRRELPIRSTTGPPEPAPHSEAAQAQPVRS